MKALSLLLASSLAASAAALPKQWQLNEASLLEYFRGETRALSERCLANVMTAEQWRERAPELRQQLAEMLSLSPMPERADLKATVTKRFEHDTFTVENLHFQSSPRLYVTANLYVPKNLTKPAPTILYVCGHGPLITNGISYGTKATYQHWGMWFARNGYVCMIIDTLESGEILGNHHGTHREGWWWWNSRGYTPAGVETWNGIRALDYLSTRPEVDTNRIGITGRSGGGAYSWFVTAMDDRIRAAAPTAGITDLENHVVDGAVEGHCDCMFIVNTYRWDYPQLAALCAPRPLLICNTDDDSIFPLDGVVRTRDKVRRIYDLLGKGTNCGLVITPGPHKDTQELQVPVMRWFNRHVKGEESLIENAAVKLFSPQQLKVFEKLPEDSINTNIHFTWVAAARADVPASKEVWVTQRDTWLAALRAKTFAAWPTNLPPATLRQGVTNGVVIYKINGIDMYSVGGSEYSLNVSRPTQNRQDKFILRLEKVHTNTHSGPVLGTLDLTYDNSVPLKKQTQIRRRFMLLGETADSKRVWSIARTIEAIRTLKEVGTLPLRLEAEGDMAVNALYASLFAPVDELVLTSLPKSHMEGPDYLNVLRILDIPQALAMASERCRVELRGARDVDWDYAVKIARLGGFQQNLRFAAPQ
jgi:hypothetical protein